MINTSWFKIKLSILFNINDKLFSKYKNKWTKHGILIMHICLSVSFKNCSSLNKNTQLNLSRGFMSFMINTSVICVFLNFTCTITYKYYTGPLNMSVKPLCVKYCY